MFLRPIRLAPLLVLLVAPLGAQNGDKAGEIQRPPPAHLVIPPAPSLSAEEAMKTIKVAPAFHLELVAAEPLVSDAIAMAFGPDGRLWVVEMHGYMPNIDAKGESEPVGDIAVLEDTDGDGRMDKRTVFLDHLVMPRAISLVAGGALVAEPPHLWFCRDTNGDGVADEKIEVANNYGNTTNPEHNANGLMWALDNWIYSANHTERYRSQGGGKFLRDQTITRGQWGISQDDGGRIYYNSNSDPLRVDLIPSEYLKRNPNFSAAGTNFQVVPANLRVWPGRVTPGINRGYKSLDEDGRMYAVTAACGPVIYRGGLFPREFYGNAFLCEPSGNLIKRIVLQESDGAMTGRNGYEQAEFVTSTDERFRPVNLFNGPDGALYFLDMYRGVIQHRTYVTTYLRKQVEERHLEQPNAKGRIYRIAPDGAPRANFKPGLDQASTAGLVAALASPNGWTRDTAQRLLVEKNDPAAKPALRELAVDGGAPALARLHALWTLDGLSALDRATLLIALGDDDAMVCAAAIRLAEKLIAPPGDAILFGRVAVLAVRPEPAVRLQLALSLGAARSPDGDAALRALVEKAGQQPFLAEAVVSGLGGREADFVVTLAREAHEGANAAKALTFATSAVLRSGNALAIERVLHLASLEYTPDWARTAVLAGVKYYLPKSAEGKSFAASLPVEPKSLIALAAKPDTALGRTATELLTKLKWPGKVGAAEAAAKPLTPAEQVLFDKGKAQFAALCAACHQPGGQGLAGLAPPLIYSRWVLGDDRVLARIVLNGKVTENLVMPPWRAALNDEAIAGVLTFIRRSWGHDASPVLPATVAEARAAVATRDEPWSDSDLVELQQDLGPAKREKN